MAEKTFNIECTMEERWIPHFYSFLKHMEFVGKLGHSAPIAFYADGDGDFRPKFNFDIETEKAEPVKTHHVYYVEALYDAG